jgi:AcrR family transcriptional regulator
MNDAYIADMDAVPVAKSERKARGQGASRRGEILEAAKRLFLTEGLERATIRKIAATVGVSSGALYLYFPDKDAMLRAIAESTFETLLAALEVSQRQADSDLERLRAGSLAYVAFGLAHPDEYRLTFLAKMMVSSGPGRPAGTCDSAPAAGRSFGILVDGIERLMQAGVFHPADPILTADAVWASLHGVTALLLDQRAHLGSDPNVLVTAVIDMVLRGLRV